VIYRWRLFGPGVTTDSTLSCGYSDIRPIFGEYYGDPFYLARGGIAWAQLPHDFPPAKTVYDIFRRWVKAGAWQRIHDTLRDQARVRAGRNPQPTAAIIDSQTVRGADTVPAGSAGYDAGKKITAANATSPPTPAGCCWRSW
jgi:hypothetical protein